MDDQPIDPRILQILKKKGFRTDQDAPLKPVDALKGDNNMDIEGKADGPIDPVTGKQYILLSRSKLEKMTPAQQAGLIAHETGHSPQRWGGWSGPDEEMQARKQGHFMADPNNSIMSHLSPELDYASKRGFGPSIDFINGGEVPGQSNEEIANKLDKSSPYAMDQSNQDIIHNKNIKEPAWMGIIRALSGKRFPKDQRPPSVIMAEQLKNKSNAGITKKALDDLDN